MTEEWAKTLHIQNSLLEARSVAERLFCQILNKNMIMAGVKESELNEQVYKLAESLFGIKKYWHKRIVRSGKNTLCPYKENPEDLTLQEEDVVYFDFGPILDGVEADFGRTYILGNNEEYKNLLVDLKDAWCQCRDYFLNTPSVTGEQLYNYLEALATQKGYQLTEWHCGHLLGVFPHEERLGEERINYICPENKLPLRATAANGESRFWILEVHLVKPQKNFGGFVEDLLLPTVSL